jgi:predicted nucleic acid-binding protein
MILQNGKGKSEMNGNDILFDSNVIIDASKGLLNFTALVNDYKTKYISVITYTEVLGFDFKNNTEKEQIRIFLNNFDIIDLNVEIAYIATEYRRKRRIKLPDAAILATASYISSCLITRNIKDFQNIDNNIKIIDSIIYQK